jgi:2-keto-3-deoxy-galactonokinase
LARALFCVRLLEQGRRSTPEERLAFLIGAFIASDLDPLMARNALVEPTIIAGGGPIAEAWRRALSPIDPRVLASEEIERALLAGLRSLTRDR